MSRNIITIHINGVGVAQFAADQFDLDIAADTVTMTCVVPNTQANPVIIDPQAESLLGAKFARRSGERVTLSELATRTTAQ